MIGKYEAKVFKITVDDTEEFTVIYGLEELKGVPLNEVLQIVSKEMDQLKYFKKKLLQHEARKN